MAHESNCAAALCHAAVLRDPDCKKEVFKWVNIRVQDGLQSGDGNCGYVFDLGI